MGEKKAEEGTWKVRLLSGNYKMDGDRAVVELYGKTEEGASLVLLNRDFSPYFYLAEPSRGTLSKLRSELDAEEEVVGLKEERLWVAGKERPCVKVTMKRPFRVPRYRDRYGERRDYGTGTNILAADIPFVSRFIYDKDLGGCVTVKGTRRRDLEKDYTCGLVIEVDAFEDCDPFHPPLRILSFDIENSIKDQHIFTVCAAVRMENGDLEYRSLMGDEEEILNQFGSLLEEVDPDVITGYNIDNYDIPVMEDRAQENGVVIKWGRDRSAVRKMGQRFWKANGRVFADAWWNAKMQLRPKKETLNAMASLVLDEEKEDVDPKKIDQEWDMDSDKVVKYCKKDAELALRILEEIDVIEKNIDLATVSRLPLDEVLNGRTSTLIDSILIRAADKNDIGVPMTRRGTKSEKITGGYVHAIEPGVYNWIITLDFKSMYPSIIISNNLCFTTISEEGKIVSPYKGVRFLSKEKKEGLIPRILADLMAERDRTKSKAREAKERGEKERADYYDGLQGAIKILMNSFYGVLASSFYRFTDNDIGASITAFARKNVKDIITTLEEEDLDVIYGDTDSVFVKSPYEDLDGAMEFGKQLASRFTKESAVLEFEKVMNPFFTHGAKKRYVGKVVWPTEEKLVRGYETRRTDAFDYQSEALERVFDEILRGDEDGAVELARELVEKVQEGVVPAENLVISRTVKSLGDRNVYKNPERMANVQAAKKLDRMGYEFVPGMKVSWIVTDAKKTPQEVEPYIDGRTFEHEPDWDYYARRVAASLARVTEVFGWHEKDLLSGQRQVSLFSSFGGDGKRRRKREIKKKDGPVNLTDFM